MTSAAPALPVAPRVAPAPDPGTAPAAGAPLALLGLRQDEMEALAVRHGASAYRGRQLFAAVMAHRASGLDAVHILPAPLRAELAGTASLARPAIARVQVGADGTRKYQFVAAAGGGAFEAVYIPEVARGRATHTLCISSQTGCAVGCRFCFTASLRRHRSLDAAEIVGQVLAVQDDLAALPVPATVTNLVFMGMGEPLLNFDAVVQACRILLDPAGAGFCGRRITISTAGIVPRLAALGALLPTQLAVSLNASNDVTRTQIMPINKKWPLAALMAALRAYPLGRRRKITIEYVLLGGVNDADADAEALVRLLADLPVKINLLPLNPHDRTPFVPPATAQVLRFQAILRRHGHTVFLRMPRGQDIAAACGQLGGAADVASAEVGDDRGVVGGA